MAKVPKQVNWPNFERKLKGKHLPLFSPLDVIRVCGVSKTAAVFLVHRYTKRGLTIRLKRGLYAFPGALPPDPLIANTLYEPSYVSLEFALSYHGIIPETVYTITSVTTKGTRRFTAVGKTFTYQRIKRGAFTGYTVHRQRGFSFQIADPEKAFVDTAYLRLHAHVAPLRRFRKDRLDREKAIRYAQRFGDPALVGFVANALL